MMTHTKKKKKIVFLHVLFNTSHILREEWSAVAVNGAVLIE